MDFIQDFVFVLAVFVRAIFALSEKRTILDLDLDLPHTMADDAASFLRPFLIDNGGRRDRQGKSLCYSRLSITPMRVRYRPDAHLQRKEPFAGHVSGLWIYSMLFVSINAAGISVRRHGQDKNHDQMPAMSRKEAKREETEYPLWFL
jgi:hypothetical protein